MAVKRHVIIDLAFWLEGDSEHMVDQMQANLAVEIEERVHALGELDYMELEAEEDEVSPDDDDDDDDEDDEEPDDE